MLLEMRLKNKRFELIDSKFRKNIDIEYDGDIYIDQQRIMTCDQILRFLYNEYKFSSECPFLNIRIGILSYSIYSISAPVITQTKFYLEHKLVLDKILGIKASSPYLPGMVLKVSATNTPQWVTINWSGSV